MAAASSSPIRTLDDMRPILLNKTVLALGGENDTKFGLLGGFAMRDVSRDPRIFEFCLTAPMDCFVKDGVGRRLIRGYMHDLLPPIIADDQTHRGLQSADWIMRLAVRWGEIFPALEAMCLSDIVAPYVDQGKIRADLDAIREGPTHEQRYDVQNLMYIYAMALFLRNAQNGAV